MSQVRLCVCMFHIYLLGYRTCIGGPVAIHYRIADIKQIAVEIIMKTWCEKVNELKTVFQLIIHVGAVRTKNTHQSVEILRFRYTATK